MGLIRKSLYVATQGAVSSKSTKQKVAEAQLKAARELVELEQWKIAHAEREAKWAEYQAKKAEEKDNG
jgi:hypothetical protein